jgi:hypothetical protein
MKAFFLLAAATLTLSLCGLTQAAEEHKGHGHDDKAEAHPHEAKAQHGGVVSVMKDTNYELVTRAGEVLLYVSDHDKPADLTGATAKLTLLSGSKKAELTLMPGKDALQAKSDFAVVAGTKAMAQVSVKGQPAQTVRFSIK